MRNEFHTASLLPPSHNACLFSLWDAQSLGLVAASILLQPLSLEKPCWLHNCTPKELATSEIQPHFRRAGSRPLDFSYFLQSSVLVTRDLATLFGPSSFLEVLLFLACLLLLLLTIWPSSTPHSFLLPPA